VDKIPDDMWSYQPTRDVRTVAQLFAHIADGQSEFCGVAAEGKSVSKGIETSLKTKAEIVPALKDAFAYCDAVLCRSPANPARPPPLRRSREKLAPTTRTNPACFPASLPRGPERRRRHPRRFRARTTR
jgi:uncharacterized damage-inducible protein DinB